MSQKIIYQNILTILFILSLFQYSQAQKQGNIWYFGQNAGLDFNKEPVEALTDGQLNTDEGCATISDANGKLLFYTDGKTVWNKNHQVMFNGTGLKGDVSSTQSAIIVPHPGNTNLYYIFTVDSNIGEGGLRVSEVDMSLQGGLGGIINKTKNKLLLNTSTEKICAVQHANKIDFWVIGHRWNSDLFYIYQINADGLNVIPSSQKAGSMHKGNNRNTHGYMKTSSDGKKLAVVIAEDKITEVFNFNNFTGRITNPTTPLSIESISYTYGVEFSPDNSKLYLSFRYNDGIDQYDLNAGTNSQILASKYKIPTEQAIGALQLGIDGRIYTVKNNGFIGLIYNPNDKGSEIRYQEKAINLKSKAGKIGLPNIVQSFFFPILFEFTGTCRNDTTFFKPKNIESILSAEWDFGDPLSGVSNTSTDIKPFHIYNKPGQYLVTLNVILTNAVKKSYTETITILEGLPKINLGNDTLLCPGQKLVLNAYVHGKVRYAWQGNPMRNSPSITVNAPGTYWVDVIGDCGISRDTIKVDYYTLNNPFPEPKFLCPNESVKLDATTPGAISYLWQDGSTSPFYTVTQKGHYEVIITTPTCSFKKSTDYETLSDFSLGKDSVKLCRGECEILEPFENFREFSNSRDVRFIWSTGSTQPFINVCNPDTTTIERKELFWVAAILKDCAASFTSIEVTYLPEDPPVSPLPDSIFVCFGDTVLVDAYTNGGLRYEWFEITGDSLNPTILIGQGEKFRIYNEGNYCVLIRGENCSTYDVFKVVFEYPPIVYLPDELLCPNQGSTTYLYPYVNSDAEGEPTFLWDDGSTDMIRMVDTPGDYYVDVTNSCGKTRAYANVKLNTLPPPVVKLPKDTIFKNK